MDDENKLNKITNEFYDLKARYEEKKLNEKARIKKNKETIHEKVSEYRKFKNKCIKCGKNGKMVFQTYKNQLKVSCPNEEDPCELLININSNIVENYYIYYSKIKKEMEDIKEKIIRKKLDLLYNLEEDDVVLQEFERIKGEFLETKKKMKEVQDTFDDRLKFDYQNDETGESEKKYIHDEIEKLSKEVNNNISEFNEKIKKEGLSGDIMSFYITDILEKQNQIRQLKYYNGFKIIESKNIPNKEIQFFVYSKEISYKNQEIVKEKGKVIDYMRPKIEKADSEDDEFDIMERYIPGKPTADDDDSDVEWSPTEGVIKKPKQLTIKIPTEPDPTTTSLNSPAYVPQYSPAYVPTTPDYSPHTPDYSPHTPDYSPTTPTLAGIGVLDELQEVNLDEITPEK